MQNPSHQCILPQVNSLSFHTKREVSASFPLHFLSNSFFPHSDSDSATMPRSDSKRSRLILVECRVVEEDRNREREEVERLKRCLLEMLEVVSEKVEVNRDHSRSIQGKSKGGRKRRKSRDERRGKSR